jgi:cephalosporin hydroxylase
VYTREEFEQARIQWAKDMAADASLRKEALAVLVEADRYNWFHQTTWFGEPVLQLPHDLLALQEIIFATRPRYIVETGVAWGGAMLFYASLISLLGGDSAIGVDIYIPDDLRQRLMKFGAISERIELINGSSIDAGIVERVRGLVGGHRDVLVVLDSNHSHEHVLTELREYSPLVGKGHYLVCHDTIVEDMPPQTHRPRAWGVGNNPATALRQFLAENDRFEVDAVLENKLLLTGNPRGYLRCVKD